MIKVIIIIIRYNKNNDNNNNVSRYVISIYFEITLNHLPIKRSISIKTILTKFQRHASHDK